MSERSIRILLEGMIEAIEVITQYTFNLTIEQFLTDRKTRDAVLMQLMVLGETAFRVPPDFRKILPDVEWGRIIRSRNIIAHEYQGIDYEIIWRIINDYLPPLKESLTNKLKEES